MNQLAKCVITILGYSFVLIITNAVVGTWFNRPPSLFLEDMAKQIISFFGGIMAKTGFDIVQAKIESSKKDPVITEEVNKKEAE